MNGAIAALGLIATLAGVSLAAGRSGSSSRGLEPVRVNRLGGGYIVFDGLTVKTIFGPDDTVSAWRYGDNVLLVGRDERSPRYVGVLYSDGQVDQDHWMEGADVADHMGDGYRSLSDAEVAEAVLDMMA